MTCSFPPCLSSLANADDAFDRRRMLEVARLSTYITRTLLDEIALDQELITLGV